MFGSDLTIVFLITSVVAMCAGNRLPDTPQTAPSKIPHSDSETMTVVEQLKSKMMNLEARYDENSKDMEERYDGIIQEITNSFEGKIKELKEYCDVEMHEIKKHHDDEILQLKHTQTPTLRSHAAAIKELKERHDEMKSSYDAEILALKDSYNVMMNKNERPEIKYDQLIKGYVSEENPKKIEVRINKADEGLHPNDLYKNQVDKSGNKSKLKADEQNEIALQQRSDPSVDPEKGRNNNAHPAQKANSELEPLKQPLEVADHNHLDLGVDDTNTYEGHPSGSSAFQVYMSEEYIDYYGVIMVHDDIRINVGGVYDTALGHFTAPTSGVYVINRSHLADGASCDTVQSCTSLTVNGVLLSATCSVWPADTAKTELIDLVAGDKVWLITSGACTSYYGNYYNSFSGYLLREHDQKD